MSIRSLIIWIWVTLLWFGAVIAPIHTADAVLQPNNMYKDPSTNNDTAEVQVIWWWTGKQDSLVSVVKWVINRVLWILAFIALIVLLYGGFLMVTAWWDDWRYDKWFTILKQAAVGLVLIWVAWFIVSIIFWLISVTATSAWPAWTES